MRLSKANWLLDESDVSGGAVMANASEKGTDSTSTQSADGENIVINFPASVLREILAQRTGRATTSEGDVEAAGEVCIVKVTW